MVENNPIKIIEKCPIIYFIPLQKRRMEKRTPLSPITPKSFKGTPINEHIINIMQSPVTKQLFKDDEENAFCSFPFSLFQRRENRDYDLQKEVQKVKLENHKLNIRMNHILEDNHLLQKELDDFRKEMSNMKHFIQSFKTQQDSSIVLESTKDKPLSRTEEELQIVTPTKTTELTNELEIIKEELKPVVKSEHIVMKNNFIYVNLLVLLISMILLTFFN